LPEDWKLEWVREHYAVQALRALHVLRRDEHYVVQDGRVVIVDEFTGRLLPDRSWEQGLHQLIETKEGCEPTGQNRTLARITYQTFFARYLRLSGMSGTLAEVARETAAVYRVPTVRVQPHRPCLRVQRPTIVAPDGPAKLAAIVAEVLHCRAAGQPVLVGTRSVAASAAVGAALAAHGIAHRILNALQNADEAALVASAGQAGRVTVATNMAGRGTDIPLEPGVAARGGLHVILTEWHESPRVDRQLFGRCARQGEPGSCRAIVALDDDLVRRHGGPLAKWLAAHTAAGVAPLPGQRLQHAAVLLLQGLVQHSAMASNAAQRRATWRYDRQMRQKLAFSGVPE
jgi:preprotein translocase subunit SecA